MSSSPFPSCFRPTTTNNHHYLPPPSSPPPPPPPPPPISGNSNLTTCLYQTELGFFSLTWSRSFLGHSLHLNLHSSDHHHHHRSDQNTLSPLSLSTQLFLSSILSFNLHIKPYLFWKKHGSKNLHIVSQRPEPATCLTKSKIKVLWDLSAAKFGSGSEPVSGFYLVVVAANGEIVLLIGDKVKEACNTIRSNRDDKFDRRRRRKQVSVLREEHLYGDRVYVTKAWFGNKRREISIDCDTTSSSDACLCFYVDRQRVLKVKKLKWKFRGNERIVVDGVPVNVSWDVHSLLFGCSSSNNAGQHAVFMFRFETSEKEEEEEEEERREWWCYSDRNSEAMSCYSGVGEQEKNGGVLDLWQPKSGSGVVVVEGSYGGISSEWKRIRKGLMKMKTARSSSSSSISMSSASSGCGSSIMEWSSVEENELTSAVGFSLLVYAWRK